MNLLPITIGSPVSLPLEEIQDGIIEGIRSPERNNKLVVLLVMRQVTGYTEHRLSLQFYDRF